jgi:hypothetical protein
MVDHGARDHATWSASATDRNWNCSGALPLVERKATPDKENPAAAWGTACHQVSEKCLRANTDALAYVDTVEHTKEHKIDVDEELAVTAQVYIDYVRGRVAEYKKQFGDDPVVKYEQHFSLAPLKPPFDAGGTGDTVMYFPKWLLIEIVDLKGGRGVVVDARGNKQLRTYALGAVIANAGLDVERVKSTIVQPRGSFPAKAGEWVEQPDGSFVSIDGNSSMNATRTVRSESYHIADLTEWTADLLAAMHRSKQAKTDLATMPFAAWAAKYLVAGSHCKFCPVAGTCPALEQRALDAAGVWFDDLDTPQISTSNLPENMSPEKMSQVLDMLDMIQEWMDAVRSRAHQQAELGVVIPEYQLSDKIGHRKWKAKEDAEVLEALFLVADLTVDEATNRKVKSPAQIEKVLGAKRKKLIEGLVERPVTGSNLVRTTKTTRPATTPAVNKHFSPIID